MFFQYAINIQYPTQCVYINISNNLKTNIANFMWGEGEVNRQKNFFSSLSSLCPILFRFRPETTVHLFLNINMKEKFNVTFFCCLLYEAYVDC